MSDRRYNDEEVAAIFERAAEAEHRVPPVPPEGEGMTLAALQEIAREVGISPESISHAVRSLDQTARPASRTFFGLPIGVGRTVELDRTLSDADWERLVADLRETFDTKGTVRYDGPFREWTHGNLQALLEPTPTGHRLRLRTFNGSARRLMVTSLAAFGAAAAVAIASAVNGQVDHAASGIALLSLIGLGMLGSSAFRLPGWARLRQGQMDAIAARLERPAD